jgi:hypothetical protein
MKPPAWVNLLILLLRPVIESQSSSSINDLDVDLVLSGPRGRNFGLDPFASIGSAKRKPFIGAAVALTTWAGEPNLDIPMHYWVNRVWEFDLSYFNQLCPKLLPTSKCFF